MEEKKLPHDHHCGIEEQFDHMPALKPSAPPPSSSNCWAIRPVSGFSGCSATARNVC